MFRVCQFTEKVISLRTPKINHICENFTASKRAIIHIQVYDMDWATGKNVTITAYVKTIKDIEPIYKKINQKFSEWSMDDFTLYTRKKCENDG